jgi:hypothetical protein
LLTRQEFYDYLISKDCEVGTFEGVNRTITNQIEIINKKTGAYFYIATPIDDRFIPYKIVERACLMLGLPIPNNAQ